MKTAGAVRREAANRAMSWARERDSCGDPEGAECFRMLAKEIRAIVIRQTTANSPWRD
jgi:hypothetical protein